MRRLLGLALLIGFFAASLGGCTCARQEVKSEPPPPPAVEKPAPPPAEPVKPVPPKKDRN